MLNIEKILAHTSWLDDSMQILVGSLARFFAATPIQQCVVPPVMYLHENPSRVSITPPFFVAVTSIFWEWHNTCFSFFTLDRPWWPCRGLARLTQIEQKHILGDEPLCNGLPPWRSILWPMFRSDQRACYQSSRDELPCDEWTISSNKQDRGLNEEL